METKICRKAPGSRSMKPMAKVIEMVSNSAILTLALIWKKVGGLGESARALLVAKDRIGWLLEVTDASNSGIEPSAGTARTCTVS
jgi:hypothetical protein